MTEQKKSNTSGYVSLILAALLVGAILLLFFQNNEDAEIVFFFQKVNMSISVLIFFCIFLGFLLGFTLMIPGRWRLYRTNKRLKKELELIRKAESITTSNSDE